MKPNRTDFMILDYIADYQKAHGFPPSVREIGERVGLSSTSSVHYRLKKLEEMGYISRIASKNRAVSIAEGVNAGTSEPDLVEVPVLGKVAAGIPITAVQEYGESLSLPASYVNGRELFILRIQGTSMINAGILDGDYVIVRHQSTADNGDIIVAMVHDFEEATVKTFYREKDGFRLQPENDEMEPIYVRELSVLGKVVGVFRNL